MRARVFPIVWFVLPVMGAVFGCRAVVPRRVTDEATVRFRDRTIDLHPFLEGFPWTWRLVPDYDAGRWLYFHDEPGRRTMMSLPLPSGDGRVSAASTASPVPRGSGLLAPERGTTLAPGVDWSARNYWGMAFHAPSRSMIVWADERADEANQLFTVPLDGGAMRKITDAPYVAGFGVEPVGGRIAWLARSGATAPFRTCLHVMSPAFADAEVVCDTAEQTFAVGDLSFAPSGDVWLRVRTRGDRSRTRLARVDLVSKTVSSAMSDVMRASANPILPWLDAAHLLYVDDESGFGEIWRYDAGSGASTKLTDLRSEIASAVVIDGEIALILSHPFDSELVLVDAQTGAIRSRERIADNSEILDAGPDRFYLVRDSQKTWLSVEEWIFSRGADGKLVHTIAPRLAPPAALEREVVQCNVEQVEIPTFDGTSVQAWLLTPKTPPARTQDRFALVEAFYGGDNVFDMNAQIVCAAGGIALSPAIRGSSGFGAAFAALNDGDMGGDEVYDLFRCGDWLQRRFGLADNQIGLWGGSHGGYETMRALTFPDGVNGRHERFPFGFGMSHGGISDLLSFFTESRIPDWMRREAGDPEKDHDKIADRSPIRHVDLLAAPLLLTVGANDTRVPPSQSRRFAARATALGKDVTLIELPGQGHHVEGIAANRALWQARFRFLERVLGSGP